MATATVVATVAPLRVLVFMACYSGLNNVVAAVLVTAQSDSPREQHLGPATTLFKRLWHLDTCYLPPPHPVSARDMKKFLALSILPLNADLGLLFLRVAVATLMIRFHGWGKLTGWADETMRVPNLFALDGLRKEFHTFPNYIGISSELSYILVTWFETFGAMMIIVGLFTRFNSLGLFITMMVAWGFHHGMRFSGPNAGEMPFAYAFCFLLLVFAGAGKYSLDRKFGF